MVNSSDECSGASDAGTSIPAGASPEVGHATPSGPTPGATPSRQNCYRHLWRHPLVTIHRIRVAPCLERRHTFRGGKLTLAIWNTGA